MVGEEWSPSAGRLSVNPAPAAEPGHHQASPRRLGPNPPAAGPSPRYWLTTSAHPQGVLELFLSSMSTRSGSASLASITAAAMLPCSVDSGQAGQPVRAAGPPTATSIISSPGTRGRRHPPRHQIRVGQFLHAAGRSPTADPRRTGPAVRWLTSAVACSQRSRRRASS